MEGIVDIANFKTCLMQANLGCFADGVMFERFVKSVEMDSR